MTKPTDKKLEPDTAGEENEEPQSESKPDEEKSSSTTSTSANEEGDKCMNPVDFITRIAEGFAIEKTNKSETVTGKSNKKVSAAGAGRRRKRASGGIKSSISLVSGLNEIGLDFDSEFEPTRADFAVKREQKGKGKEVQDTDVFHVSDTDSEEVCKKTKNERKNYDDTHDKDGAGSGAHTNLSSLGL